MKIANRRLVLASLLLSACGASIPMATGSTAASGVSSSAGATTSAVVSSQSTSGSGASVTAGTSTGTTGATTGVATSTSGNAATTGSASGVGASGATSIGGTSAGGTTGTTSGAASSTTGFTPGPHSPLPLIPGGPRGVIPTPNLVTLTFSDDANASAEDAFDDWIVTSSWLSTVGRDYGVGLGSNQSVSLIDPSAVALDGGSPSAQINIGNYLASKIIDGTLPFPTPLADAGAFGTPLGLDPVYVVYFPSGLSGVLAANVGGYHTCASVHPDTWKKDGGPNARFAFIVVQDSSVAVREEAASHEIIEASTDACNLGYRLSDTDDPWTYLGGEVADECFQQFMTDQATGYSLSRVWSNSAADAGTNPCVPAPPGPYTNVAPTVTTVLHADAGQTATVTLQGWSDGPAAPWTLTAQGFAIFEYPSICIGTGVDAFNPAPTLGQSTMDNGGSTTATLSVPANVSGCAFGVALVESGSGFWPLVVTSP